LQGSGSELLIVHRVRKSSGGGAGRSAQPAHKRFLPLLAIRCWMCFLLTPR